MLCWKLPCRSKGFIPSHPSKAAGNVFQLDHILSCMADLGWGTLPAPADPEPPLPPCPAFILTSAPRHGAGFAQESTANTKYFSPSPVFFHLFLLPPAAPDWRLWAGFSKPCGAEMALKFWVGKLGREMFPQESKGTKGAPNRYRVGANATAFISGEGEGAVPHRAWAQGGKQIPVQPLPPALHSLCIPGHSPGAAACSSPGKRS